METKTENPPMKSPWKRQLIPSFLKKIPLLPSAPSSLEKRHSRKMIFGRENALSSASVAAELCETIFARYLVGIRLWKTQIMAGKRGVQILREQMGDLGKSVASSRLEWNWERDSCIWNSIHKNEVLERKKDLPLIMLWAKKKEVLSKLLISLPNKQV